MQAGLCRNLAMIFAIVMLGAVGCRHGRPEVFPPGAKLLHVHFEWLAFDPPGRPAPEREVWLMCEKDGGFESLRIDEPVLEQEKIQSTDTKVPGPTLVARAKPFLMPLQGRGYWLKLVSKPKSGPADLWMWDFGNDRRGADQPFMMKVQFRDAGLPAALRMKLCDSAGTAVGGARAKLVFRPAGCRPMTLWSGKTTMAGDVPLLIHLIYQPFQSRPVAPGSNKFLQIESDLPRRFVWEFSDRRLGKVEMPMRPLFDTDFDTSDRFDIYYPIPFQSNRDAWRQTVEGRVETMRGGKRVPLAGAEVSWANGGRWTGVYRPHVFQDAVAKTDSHGRFAIQLDPPYRPSRHRFVYGLVVQAPGCGTELVPHVTRGDKDICVLMSPGGPVTLTLLDREGRPLAGREVESLAKKFPVPGGDSGLGLIRQQFTDGEGRIEVQAAGPGKYSLFMRLPDRHRFDFTLAECETSKTLRAGE